MLNHANRSNQVLVSEENTKDKDRLGHIGTERSKS